MDTTTDHFTPLALRVRGNNRSLIQVYLAYYSSYHPGSY